ncbi:hypothetical protein [Ornithinibacillus scapharcae]|uniref:hypothetical protein n=1 Tax=Ornithinibacillus scapharcae TaxID=1147159 RepID=UPI000225BC98|nr:hypothetical protein [Ornithinibacillus scapharcae]
MENTLEMRTDATYSLNFLIYIQNIFLNQVQSGDERKFPYMPTIYGFRDDFEVRFRELWDEASRRISENSRNDLTIFYDENELFYQMFFVESEDTRNEFNQIHQSYLVWWDSFAGRFSIERSFDEQGQKIYYDIAEILLQKGIIPQKRLEISLIYDDCMLSDTKASSYFAVISIRDSYLKYEGLIQALVLCMD